MHLDEKARGCGMEKAQSCAHGATKSELKRYPVHLSLDGEPCGFVVMTSSMGCQPKVHDIQPRLFGGR